MTEALGETLHLGEMPCLSYLSELPDIQPRGHQAPLCITQCFSWALNVMFNSSHPHLQGQFIPGTCVLSFLSVLVVVVVSLLFAEEPASSSAGGAGLSTFLVIAENVILFAL